MNNVVNEKVYIESIKFDMQLIQKTIQNLQDRSYYLVYDGERGSYFDDEYDSYSEHLKYLLTKVYLRIVFIYEILGATETCKIIKSEFPKLEKSLTGFYVDDYSMEPRNIVLDYIFLHFSVLQPLIGDEKNEKEKIDNTDILERIIKNTPAIIYDRKIIPKNEAEVRDAVFHVMKHTFPDTVREIPIPKTTKTYKPDLGVTSLKTAIEYKFADTAQEVKLAIGGIFEDMKGYAGSNDWNKFYAVIYMTDAFFTQDQVFTDLGVEKSPKNWKFIILTGKGKRHTKK